MPLSAAQLTLRPPSPIVCVIGTDPVSDLAGTSRSLNRGWLAWAKARCRQSFTCEPKVHTFGSANAGETSTTFLSRFNAGILAAVTALRPGVVVIDAFRDDATGGVALADSISNLDTLINAVLAINAVCIVRTPTPKGDSTFSSAIMTNSQLLQTFALIREIYKRRNTVAGVIVADTWSNLSDRTSSTGATLFGFTNNGVQGNPRWGFNDSLVMSEIFSWLYPSTFQPKIPSGADLWSSTAPEGSFIKNAFLNGSNAQAGTDNTGNLPDNFFGNQTANGIILTFSIVTTSSFNGKDYVDEKNKKWIQMVISGTAANTNEVCALFQNIDATLIAVGNIPSVRLEYELDTLVNIQRVKPCLVDTNGGSANAATQLAADLDGQTEDGARAIPLSGTGTPPEQTKDSGIWRVPQAAAFATTGNKQVQLRLKAAAAAAVSGTIRIRAPDGRQSITASSIA